MQESTTEDKLLFTLDYGRLKQFVAWLDAVPVPNGGLARLFAVQPPWTHEQARGARNDA